MTTELPNYVAVSPQENGSSFRGISCDDYRMLAATVLDATQGFETTLGIYPLPDSCGVALDVFSDDCCFTIHVNSALEQIALWRADLDSPNAPRCVLIGSNSVADWNRLKIMARQELEA